jgi:quercetin dioxygenase-like cupin family protein
MTRAIQRCVLVAAGVLALAAAPVTAQATPSSGVTGVIQLTTTIGNRDYILRKITIAPGGSTGWHFHDGTLYAVVEGGTLTHNESNCAVDGVFHTGDTIVEPSGSGHVHIGRNLGTTPVVLEVLYVDPAGSPLSEDAANPGCGFQ